MKVSAAAQVPTDNHAFAVTCGRLRDSPEQRGGRCVHAVSSRWYSPWRASRSWGSISAENTFIYIEDKSGRHWTLPYLDKDHREIKIIQVIHKTEDGLFVAATSRRWLHYRWAVLFIGRSGVETICTAPIWGKASWSTFREGCNIAFGTRSYMWTTPPTMLSPSIVEVFYRTSIF